MSGSESSATKDYPCMVTLQRIICGSHCYSRTEEGRIPGGDCWPDGDGFGVYTSCDDGEGYCPAPDCKWYGQCVCLCHQDVSKP